ncbi:MAG: transposase [Ruminococcaceae bacterium]|nr:transposase [Oscillospiraceae bacterium]
MDLPERKQNRLENYDYSQNGAYFITICTKERKKILCEIVGANIVRPKLTRYGKIVDDAINLITNHYQTVTIDKYVIMPDHIHLLLQIHSDRRTMFAPTIERIVKQTKGYITKQIGFSIFQRSYYDHVIRNQEDYNEIWEYIDNNPKKWLINKT